MSVLLLSHIVRPKERLGYIPMSNNRLLQENVGRQGGVLLGQFDSQTVPKRGSFETPQNNIWSSKIAPTKDEPIKMRVRSHIMQIRQIHSLNMGIEVDQATVKVIIELQPPKNIHELKGLQSRIRYP